MYMNLNLVQLLIGFLPGGFQYINNLFFFIGHLLGKKRKNIISIFTKSKKKNYIELNGLFKILIFHILLPTINKKS